MRLLHYVTLGYRAQDLSRTMVMLYGTRQLDPCTSYKRKLAQYSLYGHDSRDHREQRKTLLSIGREEERLTEQETEKESRWREQKVAKGCKSDAELGFFLLD